MTTGALTGSCRESPGITRLDDTRAVSAACANTIHVLGDSVGCSSVAHCCFHCCRRTGRTGPRHSYCGIVSVWQFRTGRTPFLYSYSPRSLRARWYRTKMAWRLGIRSTRPGRPGHHRGNCVKNRHPRPAGAQRICRKLASVTPAGAPIPKLEPGSDMNQYSGTLDDEAGAPGATPR